MGIQEINLFVFKWALKAFGNGDYDGGCRESNLWV